MELLKPLDGAEVPPPGASLFVLYCNAVASLFEYRSKITGVICLCVASK